MTDTYLLIDAMMLIGPLLVVLFPRMNLKKYVSKMIPGILSVGLFFIIWDSLATRQGHWSFAPERVMTPRIAGLPLEEILFFIIVPFACLTIFLVYHLYSEERKLKIPR